MPAIKIEFLMGRGAAKSYHRYQKETEWPPHPDRLFQAFVAAWGRIDENEEEKQALEEEKQALIWLETLQPPDIYAPPVASCVVHGYGVRAESVATSDKKEVRIINGHEIKGGQGIDEYFAYQHPIGEPSAAPLSAWIVWQSESGGEHIATLKNLAERIPYFGRSTSPVLVSVHNTLPEQATAGMECYLPVDERTDYNIRIPHPGRFSALSESYEKIELPRVKLSKMKPLSNSRFYATQNETSGKKPPASSPWDIPFMLSLEGRPRPSLERTANLMHAMRDILLRLADKESPAIKEFISGHTADGGVMRTPHLALLPLANIGHPHYPDTTIHGIAITVPKGIDNALLAAIGELWRQTVDEPELRLSSRWRLNPAGVEHSFSLNYRRYCKAATQWETVTPVIISDFLPKDGTKIEKRNRRLRKMFIDSGYPEPHSIELSRHSAIAGVPPSFKFRDDALRRKHSAGEKTKRLILHVAVTFNEPVQGPLLVGAGAHRGMGLMLPVSNA